MLVNRNLEWINSNLWKTNITINIHLFIISFVFQLGWKM
jgi:hypothetical protein